MKMENVWFPTKADMFTLNWSCIGMSNAKLLLEQVAIYFTSIVLKVQLAQFEIATLQIFGENTLLYFQSHMHLF